MTTNRKDNSDTIHLSDGLVDQDHCLDQLFSLFEELQLATVDAAYPSLDLLTFAQSVFYFAVVLKKQPPPPPPPPPPTTTTTPVTAPLKHAFHTKTKPSDEFIPSQQAGPPYTYPRRQFKIRPIPDVRRSPAAVATSTEEYPQPSSKRPRVADASQSSPHLIDSILHYQEQRQQQQRNIHNSTTSDSQALPSTPWAPLNISKRDPGSESESESESELDLYSDIDPVGVYSLPGSGYPRPSNLTLTNPFLDLLPEQDTVSSPKNIAIGLVYLAYPINTALNSPLHAGELNIGLILEPAHQGMGHARRVIELVLDKAFNEFKSHRVQAILPDNVAKDRAICLFTGMRFAHEGIRRRAFYSLMENEYKDVTYMGILDTDWLLRDRLRLHVRPAPRSVWDELFARHQREREELLNWAQRMPLRRTTSTATIRAGTPMQAEMEVEKEGDQDLDRVSVYSSSSSSSSMVASIAPASMGKGKEKEVLLLSRDGSPSPEISQHGVDRYGVMGRDDGGFPLDPDSDSESFISFTSSRSRSERSESPGGYSSSASWDVMEIEPPMSPSMSAVSLDSVESASRFEFVNESDDGDMY